MVLHPQKNVRCWILAIGFALLGLGSPQGAAAATRLGIGRPQVLFTVPDRWTATANQYRNAVELIVPAREGNEASGAEAHLLVTEEIRLSHEEAVRRLGEIAAETEQPPELTVIEGWAALLRRQRAPLPRRGQPPAGGLRELVALRVTVAVAAGERLIRFEGTLQPKADERLAGEIEEIGRGLDVPQPGDPARAAADLRRIRSGAFAPRRDGEGGRLPPAGPATTGGGDRRGDGAGKAETGAPVQVHGGFGEVEVEVSNDGQNVVVAANSGFSNSTDGGLTFTFRGGTPGTFPRDGDPSLAVGQSGDFYYAFIGFPDGSAAAGGATGCSTGIAVSSDDGATFPFRAHATVCPQTGAGLCFPDQEHIAADRVNAAAGGDQVYSVWRNFVPAGTAPNCGSIGSGFVTPSIVCSEDGGTTWSARVAIGTGDFPRVTVGSDGFVYVVFRSGGNLMLNRFSSCSAGLAQQAGFPVTVAAVADVVCPVPGLDRCNDGNLLSSHTVAVDDLDPNHVFVAYAVGAGAGNENVLVRDSTNGGSTWPRVATVNTAVTARRFLPWVCALGGTAHVTWYDRRGATAAGNDLTAFWAGSVAVKDGALQAGPEQNVSGVNDPQCASGWPCGSRAAGDSDSCSVQPQLAGRCDLTGAPCDYSAGCPGGQTCLGNGGCPKYGDYNGNACAAGRVYTAWASATAPPGLPAAAGIRVYASTLLARPDFYVRDWTASAASRDTGPEPSTNPVFYDSSDVWNRTTNAPGSFVADRPQSNNAQSGMGAAGDNFAFVRVHRRSPAAPTAPAVPVTVHFLRADFGLGSPFVNAGTDPDPVLTFDAADNSQTLATGYRWHLDPGVSDHMCLAAEITTPDDPLAPPSLLGSTAGWPTDLRVLGDNNKAQRNLWVSPAPPGGGSAGFSTFALIHNAALFRRDLRLRYQVSPEAGKSLPDLRAEIVGGESVPLAESEGELVLPAMEPGENRWIALRHGAPRGDTGQPLPVTFLEMVDGEAVNGFTIAVLPSPVDEVVGQNLRSHAAVFQRMAAAFRLAEADKEAAAARRLARQTREHSYRGLLARSTPLRLVRALTARTGDPFEAAAAAAAVRKAANARAPLADLVALHTDLLHRLDALQTRLQKEQGDPAAILETVRLQKALFETLPVSPAAAIVKRSAEFIDGYQRRAVGDDRYPGLVKSLLGELQAAAGDLGGNELALQAVALEQRLGSLAGLQKAHRELLLALASRGEKR